METRPLSRFVGRALTSAIAMFVLSNTSPQVALCQDNQGQRDECAIVNQNLKILKSVSGTYTEEATRKNIDGTVILCVTVNGQGKVTHVSPISGPPELLQLSMDAARKWEFEAPPEAPTHTKIQMTYSLTKPCPEGKGMDQGDIVTTIVPTDEHEGDLKILGKLNQPWPSYPEEARAQRRRGQLYLSMVVNPGGSVSDVRITKPLDELLDKLAVETVRTWRFKVSLEKATKFSVTLSFRIPCLDGQ